ncbi:MAG: HAD family hydrolase [Thermodesulfobacteriota bacterium]
MRAVIFDLDGTLLDTLADLAAAVNRALAARGLPVHPLDAYRFFVGEGAATLVQRALPAAARGGTLAQEVLASFVEDYGRHWRVTTRPYDGIPELLAALAGRGLALAVLSNKPQDFTRLCVGQFFGDIPFAQVLGEELGRPRKPHPAGALAIASRLGLPPAAFLYLGDTAIDMETARAAGMYGVGALWGFRSRAELEESGARALVASPQELLPLLDAPPRLPPGETRSLS